MNLLQRFFAPKPSLSEQANQLTEVERVAEREGIDHEKEDLRMRQQRLLAESSLMIRRLRK